MFVDVNSKFPQGFCKVFKTELGEHIVQLKLRKKKASVRPVPFTHETIRATAERPPFEHEKM